MPNQIIPDNQKIFVAVHHRFPFILFSPRPATIVEIILHKQA